MPVLGRIDIFAAMQADADGKIATDATRLSAAFADFLDDIRHLTLLDASVQVTTGGYELNRIFEGRGSRADFGFAQLIDGIPVGAEGRVTVDSTGNVLQFFATLRHPSTAERGRNAIGEQQAESAGIEAFRERLGVDWPLEVHSSELRYEPSADGAGLNLIWRIELHKSGCDREFRVDVRALTGNLEDIGLSGEALRDDADVPAVLRGMCP